MRLGTHVGRHIDLVGKLGDVDLESGLDLAHNRLVLFAANEGDGDPLGSETSGATDSVQELVGLVGKVVVDHDVDALDIDSASKEVRRHQDAGVEILEGLVLGNSLGLFHSSVDADGGEVALGQQPVEFLGAGDLGDENDDLVELEGVQ